MRIRKEPEELRAGTVATLICDASSSNPPAQLSWWREGIPVSEGISSSSKKGLHGGTVSSIQLKLNITPEIDGIIYTCQATNPALQRSVHDAVTMNILCEYILVFLMLLIFFPFMCILYCIFSFIFLIAILIYHFHYKV